MMLLMTSLLPLNRFSQLWLILKIMTGGNSSNPTESVLDKMLMDLDDGFVSNGISQFLHKKLNLSEFESQKKLFDCVGKLPFSQVTMHITKAHVLINFWKNLYLYSTLKFEELRRSSFDGFEASESNGFEELSSIVGLPIECIDDDDDDDDDGHKEFDGDDDDLTDETRLKVERNDSDNEPKDKRIRDVNPSYVVDDDVLNPAFEVDDDDDDVADPLAVIAVCGDDDDEPDLSSRMDLKSQIHQLENTTERRKTGPNPGRKPRKRQELSSARPGDALKSFYCRLCGEMLTTFNHMLKFHGKEFADACPICEKTDLDDVLYHLNVTHFGKMAHKCEECSHISFSEEQHLKHKSKHSTVKKIQCGKCKAWFPNQETRDKHVESRHVNEVRKKPSESDFVKRIESISCEICGISFSGQRCGLKSKLAYHQKSKHFTLDKLYKCHTCGKTFHTKGGLTKHHNTHSDARPFLCDYKNCGKRFKCSSNLKQHKTFHQPKKHVCQQCGVKFYLVTMLKHHSAKCAG